MHDVFLSPILCLFAIYDFATSIIASAPSVFTHRLTLSGRRDIPPPSIRAVTLHPQSAWHSRAQSWLLFLPPLPARATAKGLADGWHLDHFHSPRPDFSAGREDLVGRPNSMVMISVFIMFAIQVHLISPHLPVIINCVFGSQVIPAKA